MDTLARLAAYFRAVDPLHTIDVLPLMTPLDVPMPGLSTTAILVCTPEQFRPAPHPGVRYAILSRHSPLADIAENLDTNARGFDPSAPAATIAEAEDFRAGLVTNHALTAYWNEQAVAAGMFTPPIDGVAEMVGITTLLAYRRQGFAAALTSALVRNAFEMGVDIAMLRTENPEAHRIYTRLGFGAVGWLVTQPQSRRH